MSGMTPEERGAIEWACTHLVNRFTLLLDARRFDEIVTLFASDGGLRRPSDPGTLIAGRDNILAAYKARPAGKVTRHLVANTTIDVESPTRASGVCYVILYTADPVDNATGPLKSDGYVIGAYHDRFVLEDGEWRFLERAGSISMKG